MRARLVQYLNRDARPARQLCQVRQVRQRGAGDLRSADTAPQGGVVKHDPHQRRRITVQDALPGYAPGYARVYLAGTDVGVTRQHGTRVVLCLQQAGYQRVLEHAQRRCPGLVGSERPERRRVR